VLCCLNPFVQEPAGEGHAFKSCCRGLSRDCHPSKSRDKKVHDEFNFTSRMSCVPDFTTQATEESEIQGTKDAYANVNKCI
jgi:hypothetical protein